MPGITTIEGLAEMGIDPATAKAMVVVRDGDVAPALVRGDHRLHEMKLSKVLQGAATAAKRSPTRARMLGSAPSAPRCERSPA